MFLCEECLKKEGVWNIPISYGICEDCGKHKPCADYKPNASELARWNDRNGSRTKIAETMVKENEIRKGMN